MNWRIFALPRTTQDFDLMLRALTLHISREPFA